MRRPLVALQAFDSVEGALAAAREHGVHHFPVLERQRLVGVVCTCDMREARADQAVGEVMRPVVALPIASAASEAATLMRGADVGSVLVLDRSGEPCGIVTRSDLAREPAIAPLLEDCRCEACGAMRHLHRYGERQLCASCLERAVEPQAFDTGGGD
jgi:predicted transcriptional regulator